MPFLILIGKFSAIGGKQTVSNDSHVRDTDESANAEKVLLHRALCHDGILPTSSAPSSIWTALQITVQICLGLVFAPPVLEMDLEGECDILLKSDFRRHVFHA